jgi:hypothetical protein
MLGQYHGQRISEHSFETDEFIGKKEKTDTELLIAIIGIHPKSSHQTPLFRGLWDEQISKVVSSQGVIFVEYCAHFVSVGVANHLLVPAILIIQTESHSVRP